MKKKIISVLTLILVVLSTTLVNAASTGSVTLKSSSNNVKQGGEFSIVMSVKDSNGYNGILFKGIKILNKDGQEDTTIEIKSIETIGNNSKYEGVGEEEGTTAFINTSTEKTTTDVEVCKITFKVGNNTETGKYTVNINDITVESLDVQDSTTDIGTKTTEIEVVSNNAEDNNDDTNNEPTDDDNNNTNNNTTDDNNNTDNELTDDNDANTNNNPTNHNTISSNTENNNTNTNNSSVTVSGNSDISKDKMPYTGLETVTVLGIVAFTITAVLSYVKYKKYKNI